MKTHQTLILCTGNSARSIIGEYLLRTKSKGRFEVRSAGAQPVGSVNPLALRVLQEKYGIDASGARSKPWDEFKAVRFDLVITVCDHAKESCPVWPGQPVLAHWGSPDPVAVMGTDDEKYRAFVNVASQLARRVDLLCAFSDEKLTSLSVREIGQQFKIDTKTGVSR